MHLHKPHSCLALHWPYSCMVHTNPIRVYVGLHTNPTNIYFPAQALIIIMPLVIISVQEVFTATSHHNTDLQLKTSSAPYNEPISDAETNTATHNESISDTETNSTTYNEPISDAKTNCQSTVLQTNTFQPPGKQNKCSPNTPHGRVGWQWMGWRCRVGRWRLICRFVIV